MIIDMHTVVTVNYKLTNKTTGEFVEETNSENPLVFLFGVGGIIPDFEMNLHGKTVGDTFDFAIEAANAYGNSSEENIVPIPTSVFKGEDGSIDTTQIFVGAIVPMTDNQGNHMRGKVVSMDDETVKMDFNHPLADQDLHFSGEVLEVRAATQDEIAHGHVHGPGGHHH